uniref:Uncharacterized protein n=1 Tax=Arundo donax TaxID=35708 RepID=A0A0A9GTK8_ARUDO
MVPIFFKSLSPSSSYNFSGKISEINLSIGHISHLDYISLTVVTIDTKSNIPS